MRMTLRVEIDVDRQDYALNYGADGTSGDIGIQQHVEATVLAAVAQAFDRTGGWATLTGESAETAEANGIELPA